MASFREIKRAARRTLHEHLLVPALYLVPSEPDLAVNVRIHYVFYELGDQKGTSLNSSQRREADPAIIFMRDEVDKPKRGAIISVEAGEAYRVDHIYPPDDITVTADVLTLSASEASGLPVPGA